METTDLLFALLRHAVCGEKLNTESMEACTPDALAAVYALANQHDVAHLVAHAVEDIQISDYEVLAKLKKAKMTAVYRYAKLDYEYTRTCSTLENAGIPFIPLKGAVLRQYYPEPWMRTSCDIDILVQKEHLDQAITVLTESLQYSCGVRSDYDVALQTPGGMHLELHYNIPTERYAAPERQEVLKSIWEHAEAEKVGFARHFLSDEMFYFYHLSHMAKHIESGGCGIRPFLDIWILNHRINPKNAQRETLLQAGGLADFEYAVRNVAEYWFSDPNAEEQTKTLARYILRGGSYGNMANSTAWGQARHGGKIQYLKKRRIFAPYDYLKELYPVLEEKKWLMPWYQTVRWYDLLRKGAIRKLLQEADVNNSVEQSRREDAESAFQQLGL